MEIDGAPSVSSQGQAASSKRQKLNSTNAKILIKPAIGGALLPDDRAYVIDTQFFDDPFGISREEVSLQSWEIADSLCDYFCSRSLLRNKQLLNLHALFQGSMLQIPALKPPVHATDSHALAFILVVNSIDSRSNILLRPTDVEASRTSIVGPP